MNDLTIQNFPQPECLDYTSGVYRNNESYTTPYTSTLWVEVVKKYGLTIPKIIDRTMGRSVCQCGATYVGCEQRCIALVIHHDGKYRKERGFCDYAKRHFYDTCDQYPIWDLSNQFYEQKEFFSLLALIGSLPDTTHDLLIKFNDFFPEGVTDKLRIRMLEYKIEQNNSNIRSAIHEIANKMNNAGACLSFNF